jgi:hypothetical protein
MDNIRTTIGVVSCSVLPLPTVTRAGADRVMTPLAHPASTCAPAPVAASAGSPMPSSRSFPGASPLLLRELAGLKFTLEQTQAAVIGGDVKAREDLIRVLNAIGRRERQLRVAKLTTKATGPSLDDYLARHD